MDDTQARTAEARLRKALKLIEPERYEEAGYPGKRTWFDVDKAWQLLRALAAEPDAVPEVEAPESLEAKAGAMLVQSARLREERMGPQDMHELRHLLAAIEAGNSDPCDGGAACHLDEAAIRGAAPAPDVDPAGAREAEARPRLPPRDPPGSESRGTSMTTQPEPGSVTEALDPDEPSALTLVDFVLLHAELVHGCDHTAQLRAEVEERLVADDVWVACDHDSAREGCRGCAHDEALRAALHDVWDLAAIDAERIYTERIHFLEDELAQRGLSLEAKQIAKEYVRDHEREQ